MKIIIIVLRSMAVEVGQAFRNMSYYIYALLRFLSPYAMLLAGLYFNDYGNEFWSWMIFVAPALLEFVLYFLKTYANKIGKGNTVPVPRYRFTMCSSDGEVSVENDRLQELLLWVADVEDYIERHGLKL